MAKLPTEPMTVVRLDVDSFKRIKAAHVTPNATGLVEVHGRNGQGKSSLIESMIAALLGKKGAQDLPIQKGAHGAEVVLDLGEIVVKRKWRRDSAGDAISTLAVESSDGAQFKSPQMILDNLVGRFADPIAFLSLSDAEQAKAALAALGLDEELNHLEAQAAQIFAQRTDVGREADRTEKVAVMLEQQLAASGIAPLTEDDEAEVSVDGLLASLSEAQVNNAAYATVKLRRDDAANKGKTNSERIADLKVQLVKLEAERDTLLALWHAESAKLKKMQMVDIAPIMVEISNAQAMQKGLVAARAAREARAAADDAKTVHDQIDASLKSKREEIAETLAAAKFPIEGMSYDPENKLLAVGGIPLSQASSAERIRTAAAIAMAASPSIRIFFVRDGSLLDEDSLALLASIAEENGYQCWCEIVGGSAEGAGVYIEDGMAFGEFVAS